MMDSLDKAWTAALWIIERLRAAGHVALLAGGCVRDRLLEHVPKDLDVATDAPPQRVAELFPGSRMVGAKFGVVLVRKSGVDTEVATFRTDGSYSDGRRPDRVTFGTVEDDARRRDFTINGLFWDPVDDRIIDFVGGQDDLRARVIRTIGSPDQRFTEDHLRLLRAVRFASRLGFAIEPQTMLAIQRNADRLRLISPERIWMEIEAILKSPGRACGWRLIHETGLRPHLSQTWEIHAENEEVALRRLEHLPHVPVDPCIPLAALLTHFDREDIEAIGRSLRLSNRLIESTRYLVESLPRVHEVDSMELADLKFLMINPDWANLLELLRVDVLARSLPLAVWESACSRAGRIDPADIAPAPFVSGHDLAELGLPAGRRMGRILDATYRAQLNGQMPSREDGLRFAQRMIASQED